MARIFKYRRNQMKRAALQRSRIMRARWHGLLSFAAVVLLGALVMLGIAGVVVYHTYARDLLPPEEAIASSTIGTSIAYDRDGKFLYEYIDPLGGLRDPVPLDEISPHMINATISTEDASFYGNPGVNFKGLLRAGMENLTPFGPGFLEGSGGSSITQQLAKNVYIEPEKRFDRRIERKVKETVIALELKRRHSDEQILEWYLNSIYYGNFAYGVEAAAQRYFGVSAGDLTLSQASMLAGIPQAPGYYTPVIPENRPHARARQREVLNLMVRHDYITQAEADQAFDKKLTYETPSFFIQAPHFVFYAQEQVEKMCKKGVFTPPREVSCEKVVFQGGLRITTSLDMGLQRIGEDVVEEVISANEARFRGHNGALVALRAGTGEILTYVGSRDFFREDIDGQVDIVSSPRSHGSTMKPFTYLTAFEQGWVPSTIVRDAPLTLDAGGYQRAVNNWNFSHMGNISIRKALSESVNVPAVKTVMEVGVPEFQRTAHRMGITGLQRSCGPTITLGACEVKMIDQAFAFSVFANNGKMYGVPSVQDLPDGFRELDPVAVLKIEDASGNVLWEFEKPEERQVVQPEHAYMVTDILSKEAISWSSLTFGWEAASKTGTSEDFRDNVVVGYSPGPKGLVVDVWMGNSDNTPMANNTFSSAGAGPMWRTFMAEAHEYLKIPKDLEFKVPKKIVFASCGGRQEPFVEGESPTKPGICRAPEPGSGDGDDDDDDDGTPTPTPTPKIPQFEPRNFPTPTPVATPTPEPEETPTPEATATPEPTEEPEPSEPTPTPTEEVIPVPDDEVDSGPGGLGLGESD